MKKRIYYLSVICFVLVIGFINAVEISGGISSGVPISICVGDCEEYVPNENIVNNSGNSLENTTSNDNSRRSHSDGEIKDNFLNSINNSEGIILKKNNATQMNQVILNGLGNSKKSNIVVMQFVINLILVLVLLSLLQIKNRKIAKNKE